jgi:4-amino-4-deoxy-L-arabinose transferase-like glycosyltransferase
LAALVAGFRLRSLPGWDESYHGVTALRYAHSLQHFEWRRFFEAFTFADAYPPLAHLGMSAGILLFGPGFDAPRLATAVAWAATMFLSTRLAMRFASDAAQGWAALATALFAATSSVAVSTANAAMLEPWSAMATTISILTFERALRRGTGGGWLAFGLSLSAGLFVKYNHGLVPFVALPCTLALRGVASRLRPAESTEAFPWGGAAWAVAGFTLPCAWWYLLPWPGGGADLAAEHRRTTLLFFTSPTGQGGLSAADVVAYFPFACCLSIFSCIAQSAGAIVLCIKNRSAAVRFAAFVAGGSLLSVLVYPHREMRFLVPGLAALWPLAGAGFAEIVCILGSRWRPAAAHAAAAGALAFGVVTAGWGAWELFAWTHPGPQPDAVRQNVINLARNWSFAYPVMRVTSDVSDTRRQVLDAAAAELDPVVDFAWIGGSGNDFSRALVRWRLYQLSGRIECLGRENDINNHLLFDPGWDEAAFRAWVSGFPQVVTVFPPDLSFKPSMEYERNFVKWMPRVPGYRMKKQFTFPLQNQGVRIVSVYTK